MDHLSSSQINLYLICSLKYRYTYVDKLPKPFKASALAFGSAFHSTLSWLHKDRMNGRTATLERLFRIFDADWYSQKVETEIRYKESEDEMKLTVMAKEMIALYFHEPEKKIKGFEVPFTIPLKHPTNGKELGVNLEGFFDLVEEDETIVEFKTTAQAMSQADIDSHLQLSAYGYAYERLHGKPPKGFRIVNFVKNKKPRIESTETIRERRHYEAFYEIAAGVFMSIENGIFFPKPSFYCKDCEYANLCPLWNSNGNNNH